MQPSTWNERNQHWIPQFLLKGFGTKGNASRVYELDKQTKKIRLAPVDDVASKEHLHTDTDDKLVGSIEKSASRAVQEIRKGHLKQTGDHGRQIVNRLVCAMILNDPYSGFDAEATRKQVIHDVITELNEAVSQYGAALAQPDYINYFDERFGHDWVSNYMKSESNQVLLSLSLMGLVAFKPPDGEFFIIGDSPVLVIRNSVANEPSLLNPGSQVILPIGSRCMLLYAWSTDMNLIYDGGILDKEQVRSLNSDYYHGTDSQRIYGRDEETLRRSSLWALEWTPRQRSTDLNQGWHMMEFLQRFGQRQLETEQATNATILDLGAHDLVERARSLQLEQNMQEQDDTPATVLDERIRNYIRVVHERFDHDAEGLTREINYMGMHEIEWAAALNNVDNPDLKPSQRASCFHRLIEQGTGDALRGNPGEWRILPDTETWALMAPERIAKIVQRIRTEFPHIAVEFAE